MDNSEGKLVKVSPQILIKSISLVFFFSCNIFCKVFYFIVNPYVGLYDIFLLQFYFIFRFILL